MCPLENDVVLVPVRVDRLKAVLRARDGTEVGAYVAEADPAKPLYGATEDWPREDLERLYAVSKPKMRLILSHLAHQPPNRRVSLRELSNVVFEEGSDPNLNRISGIFNGLTGNSRKIRGRAHGVWPIFYNPHGETGGFEYWLDIATAEQFREIARRFDS